MPNWGGGALGAGSGALAGAEIGSIVPGIGTGIGAGVGAIAGGLMGLFKKKPGAAAPLSVDPYTALLAKNAAGATAEGQATSAEGDTALSPAMNYLKSILSGDPSAMLAATQPERGRVIDQYDTARRNTAAFGPRGGGTTGALAGSRFQQASSLSDITSGARRDAVKSETELGVNLKQLGLSQEALATQDLGTVINSILSTQELGIQKRGQTTAMLGGFGEAAGSIIGAYLTRKKTG
jgi:hypothetical protein